MDINLEASQIKNQVIEFRRQLHQCPEVAYHEAVTMEYIREHLEDWGISYRLLEPTGIVASVGNGSKTIALRSDMDALEVAEETGLEFSSHNEGYMHACGHDGHMAILLGTAKILKEQEEQLDRRVLLVFQPAEEIAHGAREVIESGVLDSVQEIYGLHIFTGIEKGKISIEAGPRMAATNWFSIEIVGQSGHAGKPQECKDTAVAASALVMNLQTIVSRNTNPLDGAVLTVGKMEVGTARNVVAGEAKLEGTVRAFSKKVASHIEERIYQMADAISEMYQVRVNVDFQPSSHPALINPEELTQKARESARKVFDQDAFVHVPAMMLGEDFANYLEKMDGCFAFVGGGEGYPNHHGKFDFSEDALVEGVKVMLVFATMDTEENTL